MHAETTKDTIEYSPFTPEHLEGAHALSQEVSWPHRLEDWDFVSRVSKGWAAQDESGRVVGTAFATPYGADCFALNLIIVDGAMQGRGIGRKITSKALAPALDHECRLVATAEGLPLYEKLGFVTTHKIHQHQGNVAAIAAPDGVEWLEEDATNELTALDTEAFGAARGSLIAELVKESRIAVIRDGERITGFAARRAFGRGEVIGPVVAQSSAQAQELITYCAANSEGTFLRIDVPETSGLMDWLTSINMNHVGGGTAMVRQPAKRQTGPAQTFALVSQALG